MSDGGQRVGGRMHPGGPTSTLGVSAARHTRPHDASARSSIITKLNVVSPPHHQPFSSRYPRHKQTHTAMQALAFSSGWPMTAAAAASRRRALGGGGSVSCCRPLSFPTGVPAPLPAKALAPPSTVDIAAWPRRRRRLTAAAATDSDAAGSQPPAEEGQEQPELPPGTALPASRAQPKLSGKERAALRAQSEALAKERRLQRLQVGAGGLTRNVLLAATDALCAHELLRVKLGEGCGLERKRTAALLAALLDAEVVGQVGFTITLYRQRGLPRPDTLLKPAAGAGSAGGLAASAETASAAAAAAPKGG